MTVDIVCDFLISRQGGESEEICFIADDISKAFVR